MRSGATGKTVFSHSSSRCSRSLGQVRSIWVRLQPWSIYAMLGHFNRHVKSCSVTPYFRVLATGAVLAVLPLVGVQAQSTFNPWLQCEADELASADRAGHAERAGAGRSAGTKPAGSNHPPGPYWKATSTCLAATSACAPSG